MGGFFDRLNQHVLRDMMRASTCHQDPSRLEHLERSMIEIAIAPKRIGDGTTRLSERGRIQDDNIIFLARCGK